MTMFTEAAFETPAKVKVNFCEDPEPEDGVTLKPDELAAGAVQAPIFCQPPCCPAGEYQEAQMVLAPAKAAVKLTVAETVTLLAVVETETLLAAMLHWELESVPTLPGVSCVMTVPASLTRSKRLVGGS